MSHRKIRSNTRSGLFKRLTKAFLSLRRFVQLSSKPLSSSDFSAVKGLLDSAEPSSLVQPSQESPLAPPRIESSDHTRSRPSPAVLAPSPPPAIMPNHDYPMVTLRIKTGSGGSAQGPIAIGGDAGDVGYINEGPRIDRVNPGITKMAIAGRGGSVGAIGTLINLQQESYHIDIETGVGGTANSAEAGDTNPPDDASALGLNRFSGVYEGLL